METPIVIQLNIFRQQLTRYIEFTDPEWEIFRAYLGYAVYAKKQHFLEAGSVCSYFGFIIKGSVRYYYVKDGVELTGYFTCENEFIGAYKSFLTGSAALNNIQALETSEIILVSKTNMDLLLEHPVLSFKMERLRRLMAEHVVLCYEDRAISFVTQTPEERYLDLMETGSEILRKIPQHFIANYLGITAVSLSRIRNRIRKSK